MQTTLLVFQCCEATGALECIFWEILQKFAELHRSEDVLLTTKDSILLTRWTHEDGQLQTDDNSKLGGVGGVRGNWGPSGEIGAIKGCRGVRASLGAGRESRYSGASRGISDIRGNGGS